MLEHPATLPSGRSSSKTVARVSAVTCALCRFGCLNFDRVVQLAASLRSTSRPGTGPLFTLDIVRRSSADIIERRVECADTLV
jgi:hypothetical protein